MGRLARSKEAAHPDLLPNVSVQVFEQFGDDVCGEWITDLASVVLSLDSESAAESVGVVIADDETVELINEEYRGLPDVTDVLSFSNVHSGTYYGDDDRRPSAEMIDGFVMSPDFDPWFGRGDRLLSSDMSAGARRGPHGENRVGPTGCPRDISSARLRP